MLYFCGKEESEVGNRPGEQTDELQRGSSF